MGAHVEWVCGTIRWGPEFKQFGDQYQVSATVICRGEVAEVVGCSGELYPRFIDDMRDALRIHGVKIIWWDRKRANGTVKRVRILT